VETDQIIQGDMLQVVPNLNKGLAGMTPRETRKQPASLHSAAARNASNFETKPDRDELQFGQESEGTRTSLSK